MHDHFHLLMEVPPKQEEGLSDGILLKRFTALYSEEFVAAVAKEFTDTWELGWRI